MSFRSDISEEDVKSFINKYVNEKGYFTLAWPWAKKIGEIVKVELFREGEPINCLIIGLSTHEEVEADWIWFEQRECPREWFCYKLMID